MLDDMLAEQLELLLGSIEGHQSMGTRRLSSSNQFWFVDPSRSHTQPPDWSPRCRRMQKKPWRDHSEGTADCSVRLLLRQVRSQVLVRPRPFELSGVRVP